MVYSTRQAQSSVASEAIAPSSLPYLWVSDEVAAQPLSPYFQLLSPKTRPTELPKGHHILALDPDTSEVVVRAIAYDLLNTGCEVDFFKVGLISRCPLEWYLTECGVENMAPELITTAFPYHKWEEQLTDPLTLKEALQIAELVILKIEGDQETDIALDALRRRAGVSEFEWNNKHLNKLRKKLERQFNLSSETAATAAERMKLDINAYLRVTDPFVQEVEKQRILSTYRVRDKDFQRLCNVVREAEKRSTQKATRLGLKAAFNLESQALNWLVPGLLPDKASVLLSGLPGSGKSLLSVDLAHAVVTGGNFLGEQCQRGKVLLINSDQPLNITVTYLADRGFDEDESNLEVVGQSGDMPAWTILDLETLETWLEEFQPNLVVIDSIRTAICYPLGLEEKSEQVGHWMKEVERLVTRYGSLLWVHHDNKDKTQQGVSRSSGSTAIPGNVSVHWRLEALSSDPSNPVRRFTTPKTRGFEPSALNIQFHSESGEWECLGRIGESEQTAAENRSFADMILQILRSAPGVGYEGAELKAAIGGSDSVYTVLGRLVARGIISKRRSKTSKGKVYFLPELSHTQQAIANLEPPLPPLSPTAVRCDDESNTQQDIQTPNTHLTPHLTPHLTLAVLDTLLDAQSADSTSNPSTPNTSTPEQGGEGVCEVKAGTVLGENPALPPIGWWVRVEGVLAQVVKHTPAGAYVKGQGREGVFLGAIALTKEEILALGLPFSVQG